MSELVLYYTFGGATQKEAVDLAARRGAALCEVLPQKPYSFLGAFLRGAYGAMHRKAVPVRPLGLELDEFDVVHIGCPIWGGYPAPVFNSIVALLPPHKTVELFFCSAGGETPKSSAGTRALVEARGCTVASYRDIRTEAAPSKQKK